MQPHLRQLPVAHHRFGRHVDDCCGFLDGQPAEEPQLDDATFPLVEFRQRLQRIVERHEVLTRLVADGERLIEGDSGRAAAALTGATGAGVIHQDATHDAGGHCEEMHTVVPRDAFRIDQAEVRLVDERGGLKAVAPALPGHASPRDLMEFPLNQRNQSLEGRLVALPPFEKEPGDPRRAFRNASF